MAYQNVPLPLPEAPGPWVTDKRCECGDHLADYKDTHYGITFGEAANELRHRNQAAERQGSLGFQSTFDDDDPPGGFRSRGPVLRMMRVMKLEAWYAEHGSCGRPWAEYPDWWAEQEDIARSQGFGGVWQWDDDDDDDDDDYDPDEYF